jgi:hypothetical protein
VKSTARCACAMQPAEPNWLSSSLASAGCGLMPLAIRDDGNESSN